VSGPELLCCVFVNVMYVNMLTYSYSHVVCIFDLLLPKSDIQQNHTREPIDVFMCMLTC
jgi:hypothetical protein